MCFYFSAIYGILKKSTKEICESVEIDMRRYIALLRGINISGKNAISMSELKAALIELGFKEVFTYLNSGNIAFSCIENNQIIIAEKINVMIQDRFSLNIPVFVIEQEELKGLLSNAPAWWNTNNKQIYDNLIFVFPPNTAELVAEKIGEPTKELEQIFIYKNYIFWSFDRAKYAKANWWKRTAAIDIGDMITIRTANTLKKISES